MKKYAVFLLYPLLLLYAFSYQGEHYGYELFFLAHSFLPFCLLFTFCIQRKKLEVFSPYVIASILYFLIFILSPMTFIVTNETDCHGDKVMDGCIYGTIIAIISFFFLTLGYVQNKDIPMREISSIMIYNKSKLYLVLVLFWIIGAVSCIIYINKTGVSLYYLLFGGSSVSLDNSTDGNNLKFLANFAYFMIFPSVVLFCFSKNKYIVIPLLLFTFFLFYARGTRIFIVIQLISLVMLYMRLNRKQIKIKYLILGLLGMMCIFSFMGSNRKNVKAGKKVEYTLNVSDFVGMLSTNFDIYKPYYGLVANCPQKMDHTLGDGMFVESIQSLVPRIIWQDKRKETTMSKMIVKTTGYGPLSAGMSWPNVAEYYMEFGIVGVIVFSFLFGYIMSYSQRLYMSHRLNDILLYSIIFPTFFQLIIRGYTPINFIMYICLLLPYVTLRKMNLLNVK